MSFYLKVSLNTLYQLIGRSLTSFANFIVILLIAKSLGSLGLGQYNKVIAFMGIFSLLVDFGLNPIFLKIGKERQIFFLIFLRLIIGWLVFIIIQPIVFILPYNRALNSGFSFQEKIYLELIALVLFLYPFLHSAGAIFQKQERFDLTVWPNLARAVIVLLIGSYSFLTKNLFFFFLANIFGLVVYTIIAFFLLFFNLNLVKEILNCFPVDFDFVKTLLKKSLPLGTTLFLNLLYVRADVLILSLLRSTTEVGIYSLAYKFFEFPLNISSFLMGSLYPVFLKSHKKNKKFFYRQVKKSGLLIFFFSLLIFLVSFVFAPVIGLIKKEFYQSILPFRILSFSYPVFFLSNLFLWVIITENKEKILPFVYGLSLVLNVILNLVFIPRYGYNAAAVITVVSELFILVFFGGFCYKFLGRKSVLVRKE